MLVATVLVALFAVSQSPSTVPFRALDNPTPDAFDAFGQSIAFDGRTAIVGAPGSFSFPRPGEVHVFVEDPSGRWLLTETLTIETEGVEGFGSQVALDGDRLAVLGSINGLGHVFLFGRTALGRWIELGRAAPSDGFFVGCEPFRNLALDGPTLLLGDNGDAEHGPFAGAVHVFDVGSGVPVETQKLVPQDIAAFDHFGESLALSGDTAVCGSFVDDPSGSIYVFRRTPSGWVEHQKILNPDSEYFWFGWSLDIDRDLIVVGAPDCPDTGGGDCDGVVFVFQENAAGTWSRVAKIDADVPPNNAVMGQAIDIDRDRICVRTRRSPSGTLAGGLRVYDREPGGSWSLTLFIGTPAAPTGLGFGWSLAAANGRVVTSILGAWKHCYQAASPGRAVVLEVGQPDWK